MEVFCAPFVFFSFFFLAWAVRCAGWDRIERLADSVRGGIRAQWDSLILEPAHWVKRLCLFAARACACVLMRVRQADNLQSCHRPLLAVSIRIWSFKAKYWVCLQKLSEFLFRAAAVYLRMITGSFCYFLLTTALQVCRQAYEGVWACICSYPVYSGPPPIIKSWLWGFSDSRNLTFCKALRKSRNFSQFALPISRNCKTCIHLGRQN